MIFPSVFLFCYRDQGTEGIFGEIFTRKIWMEHDSGSSLTFQSSFFSFCAFRKFPCFFVRYCSLFQGFQGSAGRKILVFFGGSSLFLPKKQGLEGQGRFTILVSPQPVECYTISASAPRPLYLALSRIHAAIKFMGRSGSSLSTPWLGMILISPLGILGQIHWNCYFLP